MFANVVLFIFIAALLSLAFIGITIVVMGVERLLDKRTHAKRIKRVLISGPSYTVRLKRVTR